MPGISWNYAAFKEHFFKKTGLDLESYKDRQMERRIRQFALRECCGGFEELFAALAGDPARMSHFLNFLTINTSGFFRDAAVYDYLKNTVLKNLLQQYGRLNIWSMGCSSGEEPYTLAIIADQLQALERVSILASDIDERALADAGKGCYSYRQLEKIPRQILEDCFQKNESVYYIADKYKQAVSYRRQNFLTFNYREIGIMQLILCRNVFIYFKPQAQEKIIDQVAQIIAPGGYFVIGCAEFIGNPGRFGLERKAPAVYQKISVS